MSKNLLNKIKNTVGSLHNAPPGSISTFTVFFVYTHKRPSRSCIFSRYMESTQKIKIQGAAKVSGHKESGINFYGERILASLESPRSKLLNDIKSIS